MPTKKKKKSRTTEQRKSNLHFFKIVDKEGRVLQVGQSRDYTSVFIEATDLAKENNAYWQILNIYGRVIEDNIPVQRR